MRVRTFDRPESIPSKAASSPLRTSAGSLLSTRSRPAEKASTLNLRTGRGAARPLRNGRFASLARCCYDCRLGRMTFKLTHPRLREEVRSIAGYYVLNREEILSHEGRKLLYWVGYGILDTSCCGVAGCGFALVGGYLSERGQEVPPGGEVISTVEEVLPAEREEVAALIRRRESVAQVNFWPNRGSGHLSILPAKALV